MRKQKEAREVFNILKAHYEATGKKMDMDTLLQKVGSLEPASVATGLRWFNKYLREAWGNQYGSLENITRL